MVLSPNSVFVSLCDARYYPKALATLKGLRTKGQWEGDVVLICVDFDPPSKDLAELAVQVFRVNHIPTDNLVGQLKANPIRKAADNRHFEKLYQWDKIYAFHPFFLRWERVIFLDAGLHCLDSVADLLELPWKGRLQAPDDSDPYDNGNRFRTQMDLTANPAATRRLMEDFSEDIFEERYFLNCIFVYDTSLQSLVSMKDLETAMNRYPISMCNEMGIMNLLFTFRERVWSPFPQRTATKYLFGWSELNYREKPKWTEFCFLKYPVSL